MSGRFERLVFYALLVALPLQTRVLLFEPERFASEWLSGYVYATDVLIALVLGAWAWRWWAKRRSITIDPIALGGLALLGISTLSLLWAADVPVAAFRTIKLAEYLVFFMYVGRTLPNYSLRTVVAVFVGGALVQAGIGLAQFYRHASVGLGLLGESPLAVAMPGVAEVVVSTGRFLRAYGTFPSPNVLAAYLGIALLCSMLWYALARRRTPARLAVFTAAFSVLSFAFMATFSREAYLGYALAAFIWFSGLASLAAKGFCPRHLGLALFVFAAVNLLLLALWFPELHGRVFESGGLAQAAVQERLLYSEVARGLVYEQPWGVGAGNFTLVYGQLYAGLPGWMYQPAHNVFLLVAVELGVAAMALVLFIVARLGAAAAYGMRLSGERRLVALFLASAFGMLVVISLSDHFFWTLQQGALLFWLVLGMLYAYARTPVLKL
ncbi:MAG: O-antigen ligase family protein [Candidatus Spechtbacterales bacterium]